MSPEYKHMISDKNSKSKKKIHHCQVFLNNKMKKFKKRWKINLKKRQG